MYISRSLEQHIENVSKQFPSLLLTGPRQVGKTTLLKHLCEKERTYISLDDIALRSLAKNDPALFLQKYKPPLLIDEIQYAPELLPFLKMHMDNDNNKGQFWLTGSQQFHMMQGITESLAGRIAIINLLGLSCREKHALPLTGEPFFPSKKIIDERLVNSTIFDIKQVFQDIWLGSFPALCSGEISNRDIFYSSYIQTYIERDISDLAQVADKGSFFRFFKACAARTACLINLSDLARDADVSIPTAKRWLSILESSFIIYLLQPYYSNRTKRLIKSVKLYFFDTGLCSFLTDWSSPENLASGAMSGSIFETYIISEIIKSWWHRIKKPNLFYFRNKDKKEIDLLFEQDNTLFPVEIKLGATAKQEWIKNFASLSNLGISIGDGAVISLTKNNIPLSDRISAINIGLI